jgi:uncharacterized repeat protein (TIGR01451 family)
VHGRSGARRKRWGAIGAAGALIGISALASVAGGGPASADVGDGTITITVIRDVNANSNYDPALEVGVANISVTVTDDAGTQLIGTTNASGVVTFNPATDTPTLVGGRYRVEATIDPASMPYLQPAQVAGGDLSPLTDFVDVSGGANAALTMGVINPADYVGPNPRLVTAYQWPHNPPPPPPTLVDDPRSLISFNYSDRGSPIDPGLGYTPPIEESTQDLTGTVYGIATQRGTGHIFAGAFAKRITDYGPGGAGAIYRVRGDNGDTEQWGTVPAGATPHGAPGSGDFLFWDAVGKQGLGDLDMSEDGGTLFAVNLNDRSLYAFDATAGVMGAPSVTPIPDPGCRNLNGVQDWRPFGLGVRDGVLYVGGVCSGESSGLRSDVEAHVWAFDIAAGTFGGTPVLSKELDFLRGPAAGGGPSGLQDHWNSWVNTYDTSVSGLYDTSGIGFPDQTHRRPTPMLTDIAVEADGSLVLGFRDRTGDQFGYLEASPRGPGTTDSTMTGGDLNRACRLPAGGYAWEGTPGLCPSNHTWPNGGTLQDSDVLEYYPGEHFGTNAAHGETSQGAIALALSEPRMAVNSLDPGRRVTAGGPGFYDRQTGLMWDATGANAYELFADGRAYFEAPLGPSPDYSFGKGNGLADLEIIAALAPVEIGNYVWFDADRDGLQDPGENPVPGVIVELVGADGGVVGTAITDVNGNYYFGGSFNVNMIGGLPLQPDTNYVVRVPNAVGAAQQAPLAGWVLTQQDALDNGADTIDSDGGLVADHAQVAIITGGPGFNNHTYDFGFYLPVYDLALRKTLAAGQASVVIPGDLVTFTITVFNQGTDDASNVTVTDYIPAGMSLEDPDWTAGAGNTASTVLPGTLAAGASTTVDISLRLSADPFDGQIDNHAEISSFTDEWGGAREDEDSTPDDEFGNDTLVDDEIDNGGGDEDDEDIASITVAPVFDLALRKTLAAGQPSSVQPGDLVTFTITVFNQGPMAASNIVVVDHTPDGMTLDDADWTAGPGNTATTTLPGPLAPGASTTVDISLRVSAGATAGTRQNHAEISSFTDTNGQPREDVDSTPDTSLGNDPLVDDVTDNSGGDEDDEDIASITFASTSPPPPPTSPTTDVPNPGELPATGGNSGMLATLAVLLVVGGAGVAMLARIRRRPAR